MVGKASRGRSLMTLRKLKEAGITIEDLLELFSDTSMELFPAKVDVKRFLMKLGGDPGIKGFYYCVRAVELGLENPDILTNFKSDLYPAISKEFGVNAANIERGLRRVIEAMFDNLNEESSKFFEDIDYREGKPTVKKFLHYVVAKMS